MIAILPERFVISMTKKKKVNNSRRLILGLVVLLVASAAIVLFIQQQRKPETSGSSETSGTATSTVSASQTTTYTTGTTTIVTTKSTQKPTTKPTTNSTRKPTTTSSTKPDTAGHYVQPAGAVWNLKLVNKWNPVPQSYENSLKLTYIDSTYRLDSRAAGAMKQMLEDGKQYKLLVFSAFRPYSSQTRLFNNAVNALLNQGYSRPKAEELASQSTARPGTSGHQTGLAADIWSKDHQWYDGFENTEAFKWMYENCAKYGFILRYPKGKESITGVKFEPWHYRYVGVEHATIIMQNNWTLEEYLESIGK